MFERIHDRSQEIEKNLESYQDIEQIIQYALKEYTVPQEPGVYADRERDLWELGVDGIWTDHQGVYADAKYNWILGRCQMQKLTPTQVAGITQPDKP